MCIKLVNYWDKYTEVHETATYRCDDTRGCVMQFWPSDDEHMCSKHVEAWNKLILKQKFCASSWLITEINILRCTVSKTSNIEVDVEGMRWGRGRRGVDLIYLRMCSIKCGEFLNNTRNYHLLKGTVLLAVIYLLSVFKPLLHIQSARWVSLSLFALREERRNLKRLI